MIKHGVVVQHPNVRAVRASSHERVTGADLARRIAVLKGYDYSEKFEPARYGDSHVYFVPDDTLTAEQARQVNIRTENDLFGGVVPKSFIANKTVTHPLIEGAAFVPDGWSHSLAERLGDAVLTGYSAFTAADGRRAVVRLLGLGPARVKLASGVGGNGQTRISDVAEFDALVSTLDAADLSRQGMVIEQHLDEPVTYSVGQADIAGLRIGYFGTQRLTPNNAGQDAYGGSSLVVVPGGMEALSALTLQPEIGKAVSIARQYDAAMSIEFPGLIASRRNYDIIRGRDAHGGRHTGVLEQSWRIGGASPAEIAAFEAFQRDPALRAIRASCVEVYGRHQPRADSVIYFCGEDENVGLITKYSYIEPYED